jgi:NDP-sugar pyrophosphorylase family protein
MKALLICPSEREPVRLLAERVPLANMPLLGQSLLEYWMSWLANAQVNAVKVLAHDRPEHVRAAVGAGERWGITVEVIEESRELTPAQALLKYEKVLQPTPLQNGIAVLDHFPELSSYPLFSSYGGCFEALNAWMPHAKMPDRVGIRELEPGVRVGMNSHISPGAKLVAPCWVGRNVYVGQDAVIGPNSVVEDGSFIEGAVEIRESYIGPDTFVGRYAELANSFAWGNTLINWKSGSAAVVPDAFMLCALRRPRAVTSHGWVRRLSELYARNKDDVQMVWKHLLMNKEG